MSNPGPPGEDERPLAGPDAGMGLPESGTQHATSTDFALPLDRTATPDPLTGGGASAAETPPPAQPTPPAYDDPSELVQPPPSYDAPTELLPAAPSLDTPAVASSHAGTGLSATPAYDALAQESGFGEPTVTSGGVAPEGGPLAAVKAFADQRPEAFLGVALLLGWLVGKLLSSSSDED